jgi:hypothetical protein
MTRECTATLLNDMFAPNPMMSFLHSSGMIELYDSEKTSNDLLSAKVEIIENYKNRSKILMKEVV